MLINYPITFRNPRGLEFTAAPDICDGKIAVSRACVFTGKLNTIYLNRKEFEYYLQNMDQLIQDLLPFAAPEDREFLISGVSPEGWNQTFGEGEER